MAAPRSTAEWKDLCLRRLGCEILVEVDEKQVCEATERAAKTGTQQSYDRPL